MGAAGFPGLDGGRAGLCGLAAWGFCHLSLPFGAQPTRRAGPRYLAAQLHSCTLVRASPGSRALVPRCWAQASGCVVVRSLRCGHLVLGCPRWTGAQAGFGRPSPWQWQAEQGAKVLASPPHIQAAARVGRETARVRGVAACGNAAI